MRGKVLSGISYFSGAGITPAYAGKSCRMWLRSSDRGDHPRICGEKKLAEFNDENGEGSPPHMRGKGNLYCFVTDRDGITPAYAGKSSPVLSIMPGTWDHPRICGEKPMMCPSSARSSGSPPHMRGKALLLEWGRGAAGITPAYAGKSVCIVPEVQRTGDHPRICGEKLRSQAMRNWQTGSPPHMRGKEENEAKPR